MNELLKKFLLAYLKTTLGMDETEASKLFKEDGTPDEGALKKITDLDANRVATLSSKVTESFDNGYKKAQYEVLSKFEGDVKAKYKFEGDKKGIELVDEIITAANKAAGKEPNEDQVKRHPAYQKLLLEKDQEITDKTKKLQEDFDTFKSTISKREAFAKVKELALTQLEELNPVLSDNPTRAANQKQVFIRELENLEYEFTEDGKEIKALKKDGKILQNAHGHVIQFKDFVKQTAEGYYDFKAAADRSSGGGGAGAGAGGGAGAGATMNLKKPANSNEYVASMKAINENKNLAEADKFKHKDELTKLWEVAKSEGAA